MIIKENTNDTTIMNSGLILGPPASESENLIIPIDELGPELVVFDWLNFILHYLRNKYWRKTFIYKNDLFILKDTYLKVLSKK